MINQYLCIVFFMVAAVGLLIQGDINLKVPPAREGGRVFRRYWVIRNVDVPAAMLYVWPLSTLRRKLNPTETLVPLAPV